MVRRLQNKGFSLAEVMMATGILAIGFVFIAGVFPVGVKLTAEATEQTIAPIVADEAIAKIKLYADPNFVQYLSPVEYRDFSDVAFFGGVVIPDDEFGYPSTDISPERKKYHWSALCGLLADGNVHVTVFVTRISGAGTRYLYYDQGGVLQTDGSRPVPVRVQVSQVVGRRLRVVNSDEAAFINGGSTILDGLFDTEKETWQIYRVLERDRDAPDEIMLDRDWEGPAPPAPAFVWVVPPAAGSSRYPCIGVYQKVVSF
ncbi:MAG: type IV pilus modification PilV family protein [Planctomycetota bacterium]|jgi:prepilin-type N-terminal cleavage/methylation domain-containing protein